VTAHAPILQSVLDSLTDGVAVVDDRARPVSFNAAWERVFGPAEPAIPVAAWPTRHGLYRPDGALLPIDDAPLTRALRGEHAEFVEVFVRNGRVPQGFHGLFSAHPLREDQKVTGAIAVLRDVSAARNVESELWKAKHAAEEASRAKSEFLANMSHEIRTPMNGIIGLCDLLLGTSLDEQQREYARMLRSSGQTLLRVINDILDFSRIEARRLEIDPAPFDVRNELADLVKPLAVRAREKGLEFSVHVARDVPETAVADFARLGQVLVNLVDNAIKFTPAGEIEVRVGVEAANGDSARLRFSVIDTGVGVPPARQEAIFDPFAQADASTTRRFGGTGLGLSISSQLVRMMGGALSVESAPGRGSTFSFAIPVAIQGATASADAVPRWMAGARALVIDDDPASRAALQEMLRTWGMRPTTCVDTTHARSHLDGAAGGTDPFRLALVRERLLNGEGDAASTSSHPALQGALVLLSAAGEGPGASAAEGARRVRTPVRQSELLKVLSGDQPKRRTLRVLLAEDNAVNQFVARNILERHGHHVVIARNGREALARVQSERFDVVLMDVQMPEMDGLSATRAIRELEMPGGAHLPIVAVTAHAMKGDRQRCLEAGMDAYVAKPLRPDLLLAAIDDALSGHSAAPGAEPAPPPAIALDEPALLALVGGDRKLLLELAQLFAQDAPRRLADLRGALAAVDFAALARTAHALKGSAASVCGRSTAAAALAVESAAHGADREAARRAVESLCAEMEKLEVALFAAAAKAT
jgi:signal transduction histidine kinase/DNA-binding response OmpR family regulator